MSDFFREQLEAVFREDDRLRAEHERWEYEWAKREKRQQQSEIVYKSYEPPAVRQSSSTVDSEAWNTWCDERIARQIATLADIVGSETARNERKLEERLLAEI